MRQSCRLKTVHRLHKAPVWLSLFTGVSVLAIVAADPAYAQNAFVLDTSDPSISVDLSVLNDGGLSPQLGMPTAPGNVTSTGSTTYQMPGPQAPVSTLYIQPEGTFTLPPQSKTLIAMPSAEVEPVEAETLPVEENLADLTPPPPAPEVMPEVTLEVMPEPVPVPEAIVEAAPEPAPEPEAIVEAAPEPAPEPEAVVEVTPPQPVAPEVVEEPMQAAQTPPPPPQVLSQPAPQEEAVAEAPVVEEPTPVVEAPNNSVVVSLPPKLEEAQPGVASLPSPTGQLSDGDSMRIVFENDSSKLPSDVREALKGLSDRMNQQENLRLQLLAYAGDTDTSASAARRLSLSRALAVRSYLIENGVRSTRIDVRALGNKSTEEVTERVDITVVER